MAGHSIRTVLAMVGISIGLQGAAWGMANRPKAPALLVIPGRNVQVLKIGFDLIESRRLVLVAYQSSPQMRQPALHVWNGEAWLPISMDTYQSLSFMRLPPTEVILVGTEETMPASLAVEAWSARDGMKVLHVSSHRTAGLLNELGRIFDFSRREWEWYAARYQLDISDANQAVRGRSFYDDHGPLVRPSSHPRATTTPAAQGDLNPNLTGSAPPAAVVEEIPLDSPPPAPPQSTTPGMLSQPPPVK